MRATRSSFANKLLQLMPPEDLAAISAHFEYVELDERELIETPGERIETIYFPEFGLISTVAVLPRGRDIEVGIIGVDGMTGTGCLLDDHMATFSTFVQIAGGANRIAVKSLLGEIVNRPETQRLLLRYVRALNLQLASTAVANGRSKLEERLARWIIMVQDRTDSDRIFMTHEFLSLMLGVRRAGVTVALHMLEGKGLIRSERGKISIRDREGLIDLADGAYGLAEREYRRLLGVPS